MEGKIGKIACRCIIKLIAYRVPENTSGGRNT